MSDANYLPGCHLVQWKAYLFIGGSSVWNLDCTKMKWDQMKRKVKIISAALVLVAVILVGYVFLANGSGERVAVKVKRPSVQKHEKKARLLSKEKPSFRKKGAAKRGDKPEFEFDSVDHPYSAQDKKLAMAVQEALDADDYENVLKTTAAALKAANPDVRLNAVEALGWYGEQALPELTTCMADPDEDVAQAAMSHWEQGVAEIDDSVEKLQISLYALNTIVDADTLTMVGSHFASAAFDLIDGEEDEAASAQKRVEVVQALADVIEEGKEQCAKAACDVYEEITGNKWISIDEAEKYLSDPDNYDAPESSDDD